MITQTAAFLVRTDVPEFWENPGEMELLETLTVFVGIPLLLALVIAAAVYVPAILRGENVTPGGPESENAWLGGPRRSVDELAAPDSEDSAAGGASARW